MSYFVVSDQYIHDNFNLKWPEIYSGIKYKWLSDSFPIFAAQKELSEKKSSCVVLINLSNCNGADHEKITELVKLMVLEYGLDNFDEEEITNKHHYIVMKYIYDNPQLFPDQIKAAEDYAEEWDYPSAIWHFANPFAPREYYSGDAVDVKKQVFAYWKKYLEETKEEYGWRTFQDFLKHEGVPP